MIGNLIIRPATKKDRFKIKSLVYRAFLNPTSLDWQRFWVAEIEARIVGVRQVKQHNDGVKEVASGVVLSRYRHKGISTHLMCELLKGEVGPLYLMCDERWVGYYKQFGFEREPICNLPLSLQQQYKILKILYVVASKMILGEKFQLTPMIRASK